MSTETLTQQVGPGASATFGNGSIFVIVSAVAAVTVVAQTMGSSNKSRTFTNVPAGFKFTADNPNDGFDRLVVTSATLQNVTMAIGDDDVEFSNAVTVNGSVVTQETPKTTVTSTAPVVTAAGGASHALFAANASRRSMTVFLDPASPCSVYLRTTGGANNVAVIQPGMSLEFDGTYGLDYSDTLLGAAGGNTLYLFEES